MKNFYQPCRGAYEPDVLVVGQEWLARALRKREQSRKAATTIDRVWEANPKRAEMPTGSRHGRCTHWHPNFFPCFPCARNAHGSFHAAYAGLPPKGGQWPESIMGGESSIVWIAKLRIQAWAVEVSVLYTISHIRAKGGNIKTLFKI